MSQIATTIEQSKRLLAAGLDPRSCDMRWTNEVEEDEGWGFIIMTEVEEYHLELGQPFFDFPSDPSIPAWSLSRLWDIMKGPLIFPHPTSSTELMTILVSDISERANDGTLSKELLK